MIDKIKRKLYTLIAEWKYRKHNYDEVCCCGNTFQVINIEGYKTYPVFRCGDYSHTSRCAKEYAVSCYVESKMNKEK